MNRNLGQLGFLGTALVVALLVGCSEAGVQPIDDSVENTVDDLLQIDGEVCTSDPEEVVFPVKIMVIVDGSGSMQFTDPSDANTTTVMNGTTPQFDQNAVNQCIATCQSAKPAPTNCAQMCGPKLNPGRVAAVQALVDRFKNNPAVSFAVIRFNGRVTVNGSSTTQGIGEFTNDEASLNKAVQSLTQADITTDYQGALTAAYQLLEKDMVDTSPVDRARTKYVVIFLSDGAPNPVCKEGCGNDTQQLPGIVVDSWCDVPRDEWCDNFFIEDSTHCKDMTNWYPHMKEPCRAYNTEIQLKQKVLEIIALGDQYGAGEIRMHTAFLFLPSLPIAVQQLMAVEGSSNKACTKDADCPLGAVTKEPERCWLDPNGQGLCKGKSEHLLRSMAEWGSGVFRNFSSGQQIDFLSFNYSSVARPFGMTNFIVSNLNTQPVFNKIVADSDGDGVNDNDEFAANLNMKATASDSDGDGYNDKMEYDRRAGGFDPGDPLKPETACPAKARKDDDGDGLNDCEEKMLGTDPKIVDSDRDRIPDGIEFLWDTDPLSVDDKVDIDFDGKLSGEEIRIHANPKVADPKIHANFRYIYDVREQPERPDKRKCYKFTVRRIRLVTTELQGASGSRGYNNILLTFGEGPADDPRDFGKYQAACVRAQYVEPDFKDPLNGRVTLEMEDFMPLHKLLKAQADAAQDPACMKSPPDEDCSDPCKGAPMP
jgi:hypothetical protein